MKEIMIDYILFDCKIVCYLDFYYVFKEGVILIIFDYLLVFVFFSLRVKLYYLENFYCKFVVWYKVCFEVIDNYK